MTIGEHSLFQFVIYGVCKMDRIYRVSFIGHRGIDRFFYIEEQVREIVERLIKTKEYVEFYVGRNGEFDLMVASVIKRAQRDYDYSNSSLILVLAYPIANMEDMEKYYDEVWYPPEELYHIHYKAAITKRNEWFVNNSDLLVAYVIKEFGGAYECLQKARKAGIDITLLWSEFK